MNIGNLVRKAVKKLADAIDNSQDRMTHEAIITSCANTTRSVVGSKNVFMLSCNYVMYYTYIHILTCINRLL